MTRAGYRPAENWLRVSTVVVIALLTIANLFAANAAGLLATGGMIWATNVIAFGLRYWDPDRGGTAARFHHPHANPAFVFAEINHTDYTPANLVPKFAGYLSLSFWTATAFSRTDVTAIKPWAKLLMMTEAVVSLVIGVLVIARAVNILKLEVESSCQPSGWHHAGSLGPLRAVPATTVSDQSRP